MRNRKKRNPQQLPYEIPREEVIPVRVPPEMADTPKKPGKSRGNRVITFLFYSFYFLLILVFCWGINFLQGELTQWLVAYEAAQPYVISEAVFQAYFTDPDWNSLYETAGITDTVYEGKDTFVAYMDGIVSDGMLTYVETAPESSGDRKYLIQSDRQTLGHFTLSNHSTDGFIPNWQLNTVVFYLNRSESVTIEKMDGCTAYVNGQPLGDDRTQEILSTLAENYLPDGTFGIRRLRQTVADLLLPPTVMILDENGAPCPVEYDPETEIYSQVPPEQQPISRELENRAIAAGEAFCYYMVNRDPHLLGQHFAPGTTTYRNITGMEPWEQDCKRVLITQRQITEYTRYTDDLFSVQLTMTMRITREDNSRETYPLDATFFLENRKAGWMVISMTYADISLETRRVRLTFMNGNQQLSTAFYDSHASQLFAPQISIPQGQTFTGWAEKEVAPDGTTTLHLRFTPDENGRITIPRDMDLTPMTLYAVFESEVSEREVTQ